MPSNKPLGRGTSAYQGDSGTGARPNGSACSATTVSFVPSGRVTRTDRLPDADFPRLHVRYVEQHGNTDRFFVQHAFGV